MSNGVLALSVALALIVIAIWLFFSTKLSREKSGVPRGALMYVDGEAFEPDPLYAHDIGLVGKPDYLVRVRDGTIVPVEVKSSATPDEPYESHVMQLASYCYLVEAEFGIRPNYGFIQYPDEVFRVDYDYDLETAIVDVITDMKADLYERDIDRSHDNPNLCAACGVRDFCDQRLTRRSV